MQNEFDLNAKSKWSQCKTINAMQYQRGRIASHLVFPLCKKI